MSPHTSPGAFFNRPKQPVDLELGRKFITELTQAQGCKGFEFVLLVPGAIYSAATLLQELGIEKDALEGKKTLATVQNAMANNSKLAETPLAHLVNAAHRAQQNPGAVRP